MESLIKNMEEYLDENCSVCSRQLTRFGSKKLQDGMLCRYCAGFSSAWLKDEDYLNKTVKMMQEHLKYRKNNHTKFESFKTDIKVEGKYDLCVDLDNKQLYFSKRKDVMSENPDIISFDEIQEISIIEEQYLKQDGVDVMFEIKVNNEQFDDIYFRVNEFPGINKNTEEYKEAIDLANKYLDTLVTYLDFQQVV